MNVYNGSVVKGKYLVRVKVAAKSEYQAGKAAGTSIWDIKKYFSITTNKTKINQTVLANPGVVYYESNQAVGSNNYKEWRH